MAPLIGMQCEGSGLAEPGLNTESLAFCLCLVNQTDPSVCCSSAPSSRKRCLGAWKMPIPGIELPFLTLTHSFLPLFIFWLRLSPLHLICPRRLGEARTSSLGQQATAALQLQVSWCSAAFLPFGTWSASQGSLSE